MMQRGRSGSVSSVCHGSSSCVAFSVKESVSSGVHVKERDEGWEHYGEFPHWKQISEAIQRPTTKPASPGQTEPRPTRASPSSRPLRRQQTPDTRQNPKRGPRTVSL